MFLSIILFTILIAVIISVIFIFVLNSRSNAVIITTICKFLKIRQLVEIRMSRFYFNTITFRDCYMSANLKVGNVNANFEFSFEELRCYFSLRKWMFTIFSNTAIKPLHIHIKCLSINGSDMSMLSLLLPSESKLNGAHSKSTRVNLLRRLLMRLIEVTIDNFESKTFLTSDAVDIAYNCKVMHVSSHDNDDDPETLLTTVTSSYPQFTLSIREKNAFRYESNCMVVKILENSVTNDLELLGNFSSPTLETKLDHHSNDLPSDLDSNKSTSNMIKIQVQNLLSIYHIYQSSLDEVLQVKINHNIPLEGNIRHIMGEFEDFLIELIDDRIVTPLEFRLQGGVVDMSTTLPKGKSRKKQVVIKRSCMTMKTVTCLASQSVMKDVVAVRIVRRLKIPETSIDEEDEEVCLQMKHMIVNSSADSSKFPILDWIFILQSIPQSLPLSRFRCNNKKVKQKCMIEFYSLSFSSHFQKKASPHLEGGEFQSSESELEVVEPEFYIYAINLSGTRTANTITTISIPPLTIEDNLIASSRITTKIPLDYLSDRHSMPSTSSTASMIVTADDLSYIAGVNINKLSYLHSIDTTISTTSTTTSTAVNPGGKVKIRYSLTGFSAEFVQRPPQPPSSPSTVVSHGPTASSTAATTAAATATGDSRKEDSLALQRIVTSMRVMPFEESTPSPSVSTSSSSSSSSSSTTGGSSMETIDFPFTLNTGTTDSSVSYITVTRIESIFEIGKVSIGMAEVASRVGTADIILLGVTQRIVQWGYKSIRAAQDRVISSGPALLTAPPSSSSSSFPSSATPSTSRPSTYSDDRDPYRYKKPNRPPDYSLLVSSFKIDLVTTSNYSLLKRKKDGNIQLIFEKFSYVKKNIFASIDSSAFSKLEDVEVRYSWKKLMIIASELVIDPPRQLELLTMDHFNFQSHVVTNSPDNSNHRSSSNSSSHSPMKEIEVSCSGVRVFAAAVPALSSLLQEFQHQIIGLANAWRTPTDTASRISSNSNSDSSSNGGNNGANGKSLHDGSRSQQQNVIPTVPFKYTVKLMEFEIAIEGLYYYRVSPRFLVVKLSGLQGTLQSTDSATEMQEKIHILDGSAGIGVQYGNIFGGELDIKLNEFIVSIEPMETACVVTTDVNIRGLYYNVTACSNKIGFTTTKYTLTNELDTLSNYNMSTTIVLSNAPPKHYMDLAISAAKVDVTVETCTNTCIDVAMATLSICLPPRSEQDGSPPPLMWWDQARYWLHGSLSMQIEWFVFKKCMIDSRIRVTQVACSAHFFKIEWRCDELEVSASELVMDVEAENELDMLGSANSFSGSSGASSFSSFNSTSQSSIGICPSPINYRCCTIPGFVFSLSVRTRRSEFSHSHHDVYLKRNDTVDDGDLALDKFLHFRCSRGASDCTVRLQCADRPDSPITVWARLDIIRRVLDAYSYTSSSKVGDANLSTRNGIRFSRSSEQKLHSATKDTTKKRPVQHPRHRPVFFPPKAKARSSSITSTSSSSSSSEDSNNADDDDDNDVDADDGDTLLRPVRSTTQNDSMMITSLQDLIGRLDLYIHIEQFVASTWSSSRCLHGIVFVQRKLTIKMVVLQSVEPTPPSLSSPANVFRNLPVATDSAAELYMDHLSAEISYMEIFARDWKMNTTTSSTTTGKKMDKKTKRNKREGTAAAGAAGRTFDHEDTLDDLVKEKLAQSHMPSQPAAPSEPTSVLQLQSMFAPIHKWGHASKVTIQQKEYNNKQSHTNENNDNKESKDNKNKNSNHDDDNNNNNTNNHTYRPTFSSFLQNHIAFTPPRTALPPSFYYTHSPAFCAQLYRARQQGIGNTDSSQVTGNTSRVPKLLSLCITDVKLLWTISIRDSLFIYGMKFYQLFMARDEKLPGGGGAGGGAGSAKTDEGSEAAASLGSGFSFSNKKKKKRNSKATMMDFLDVKSVRPRGHRRMHITGHAPVPMPISDNTVDSDSTTAKTSPQLSLTGTFPEKYMTSSTGFSTVNILSPCPEDGSVSGDTESSSLNASALSLTSPMTAVDSSPLKIMESPEGVVNDSDNNNNKQSLGYRDRMRQTRPNSLRYRSLQDGPRLFPSGVGRTTATTSASKRPVSMMVRRTQPEPQLDDPSMIPRSRTPPGLDKLNSSSSSNKRFSDEISGTLGWQKQSFDQMPGMAGLVGNRMQTTEKEEVGDAMEAYFTIEFINPQLNFLDDKSQGSLVMVAGNAIVEGKRSAAAILSCPHVPTNTHSQASQHYSSLPRDRDDPESHNNQDHSTTPSPSPSTTSLPQRKYEVRLRMDGVSMFTVPTNLEGMEATVHWKPYRCEDFENESDETATAADTDSQMSGNNNNNNNSTFDDDWVRNNRTASVLQDLGRTDLLNKMKKGRAYSENERETSSFASSELLQVAVKDFQIRAAYSYFLDVSVEEAAHMVVNRIEDDLVCTFMLDLPAICVDIDSSQFFIMTHVVREVMLSPPPPNLVDQPSKQDPNNDFNDKERASALLGKQQQQSHTVKGSGTTWSTSRSTKKGFSRSKSILFSKAVNALQSLDLNTKGGREELKNLVEKHFEELKQSLGMDGQEGEDGTSISGISATNTYVDNNNNNSSSSTVRMTRSVEYCIGRGQWFLKGLDSDQLVEVGFMGLYGSHSFNEDRSSSTLFEVQRFWARNHRPGPESSGFEDESLIVSTLHHRQEEPCIRCGAYFKPMDNAITSCVFHADDDGQPGEFIHSSRGKGSYWTCCGQNWEGAQGCSSRPHVCKEMMITIRADAEAALAVRGVDLTILQTLEVSVFPGSTNAIRVQITSSLIALLHQYFVIEDGNDEKYRLKQLMGNAPASSLLHRTRWRSQSDYSVTSSLSPTTNATTATSMWSVPSFTSPTFSKSSAISSSQQPLPLSCSSPHRGNNSRKEGLYVKYLRVGEIGVEVSTAGFPINLDRYKAIVEPFVKHGKVYDWQRLIHKLERHSTWSLTKNTASTSLARLTGMFFRTSKKATESTEGVTAEVSDDALRVALLLGGGGGAAAASKLTS